ncbi:DUF1877 family protein [Actinoallomurus soli]|uniref:DUF1877 family protein n=1 Tax=Actinoallomurus soli TaxID=2952535 RepID=UPI00209214C9|nr:DUF1877 family protein [Actinoallomurus soli]MCO5972941.1 YfbM family protein [Actinoallomurus soli]
MAVTQQLARVSGAELDACRASVETLDLLCSFDLRPESDHLDLDWAPEGLVRCCEPARVDASAVVALRRALDGDDEVNPAYRDAPDSIWGHPVTALAPGAVAEIAGLLRRIDPQAVLGALPADPDEARTRMGRSLEFLTVDPHRYLEPHFSALLSFYRDAADRGPAVVLWWD